MTLPKRGWLDFSLRIFCRQFFLPPANHRRSAALAVLVFLGNRSPADSLKVEVVKLPALRINGLPATAHTQGLEVAGGSYYVTARREDVSPKRALLLRTGKTGNDWDSWDLTPLNPAGDSMLLDHPGGMQSDGKRLWIPVAQSKRKGRSVIRVFSLAGLVAGQPLKPEFEFPVNDHIGAVAVSLENNLVFGASWDTEAVYVWDLEGRLQRIMGGSDLALRGLGAVTDPNRRAGLAVQDWKIAGNWLFASGLFREASLAAATKSRLMSFTNFLESDFQRRTAALPLQERTELGREAMAIVDNWVYFLPEDLAVSNRMFRVSLAELGLQPANSPPRIPHRP